MHSPSPRALDIWMNGELVGVWYPSRSGASVFQYDETWRTSPYARALSLSLPFLPGNQPHKGDVVTSWFDNLLPDSEEIRKRLGARFGTYSLQTFDLLAAIGRDCVGAVQLVPSGLDPGNVKQIEAEEVSEAEVAKLLRGVTNTSTFGGVDAEEFRISIAGAQEKTALLKLDGRWCQPRGATPTTHILKLPLGLIGNMRADMADSVENEWLCMQLLQAMGFQVADTEIGRFQDEHGVEKALVVSRFDRRHSIGDDQNNVWIQRLPQEDFCQATGTPANKKYEQHGGPGIPEIVQLLAAGDQPDEDRLTFAKTQLAFWLLAAPDGHAKNFSIFLTRSGGYTLTPLYDVLSAWPIIGKGPNEWPYEKGALAMGLHGTRVYRKFGRIGIRHWKKLAARSGVPLAFDDMVGLVERAGDALATVHARLPDAFPDSVWSRVSQGVLRHRERFLSALRTSAAGDLDPGK